ncbi:MAG: hypothetical protein SAK29_40525 [Scytonema sp. PMC 1069.18]|nr:hypothetical protein [Scytonema sp. PMC 1069.18]MEC4885379.1 hypothetical protein [Scytonema sp. PMC 1070.18]
MTPLNLSQVQFTDTADKVYSDSGIFNPAYSDVKTLKGADELIGNDSINSDFGFGVFVGVTAENANAITSADLSSKATVNTNGIHNKGSIRTNEGRDIVRGTATAKIAAIAQTVSEAIAYADRLDTSAIADTFAAINIQAVANGIKNSGEIRTGQGSDTIDSEVEASIAAVATATADATAIVEAIAKAPVSDNLTAFAGAIAQSLAQATITATGIQNIGGKIGTGRGADTISATATSYSATYAQASAGTVSSATPENQALAKAVAQAIAIAEDKAIAIDNTQGEINLGLGLDTIKATANASDKAIAIKNTQGIIRTGEGADVIQAYATGLDSYGIFGGTIETGDGADSVEASSFGGNVNIDMGDGKDFVKGFGDAIIDGGRGFDILSLESYNIDDFNISLGANNNKVIFERNDITMTTTRFEQFNFNSGSLILTYDELVATL